MLMLVVLAAVVALAVAWPPEIVPDGRVGATIAFGIVVGILGAASTVGLIFSWWHFRLEMRAWEPGPVTVLPFRDHTPGADKASRAAHAADLKASFEDHLVQCRFARVTPVPSADSTTDFLSVVEAASDDLRGPWGAALRFTRLLTPTSAYQVTCTVQPGTDDEPHVLLVEVSRVAGPSVAPVVVRARTSDEAAEKAAHAVASCILPRTRLCRQAPWSLWRDRRLPVDLYRSYQRFRALQADRHFDEAMAALRHAVRLDPGNLSLRLDLGKLQERMQLYLDALLTYDDIITVAAQSDSALSRWWSHWLPVPRVRSRLAISNVRVLSPKDPVILIARYRHALLLGLSDTLASQWWGRHERCVTGRHQTSREWRRAHLREALSARLARRYRDRIHSSVWFDGMTLEHGARPYFLEPLREVDDDGERDRRTAAARVFFTSQSRFEFEQLTRDWTSRWTPWRQRSVLPPDALQIGLPWSALRYRMAVSWAERSGQGQVATTTAIPMTRRSGEPVFAPSVRRLAERRSWPPGEMEVESIVGEIASDAAESRSWRAHYNAACLLSLPLLFDGPPVARDAPHELDDRQKQYVANRAVRELVRAVQCADTGFVIRQRDWLLSEDPDLDHLRERREFKDFEATTFGSIGRAVERGPDIHRWEQSTYVARFIRSAAEEMALLWRRRLREPGDGEQDWTVWLDEDMAGWGLAERLALDSRDSHTREDVTRRIAETGRLTALQAPYVRHPLFSDVVLDRQLASMDGRGEVELLETRYHGPRQVTDRVKDRVATAIGRSDERLTDLAVSLREPFDVTSCGCTMGQRAILAAEELALRKEISERWRPYSWYPSTLAAVSAWAEISARRWAALSSWFDDEAFGHGSLADRRDDFRRLIEQDWRKES
jgi:hypothetical protein